MVKKRVWVFVLLLIVFGAGSTVYASDSSQINCITFSPTFSFQRIFYSVDNYTNRNGFGLGAGLSYDHFLNSKTTLGVAVSYEYFIYRDFYHYNDLKTQATVKRQLCNSEKNNTRLFLTSGAGCDFVFRNDCDFGVYPLFNLGLETVIKGTRDTDITLRTIVGITIQNGSVVLQANAGAGLRFGFGKPVSEEKKK